MLATGAPLRFKEVQGFYPNQLLAPLRTISDNTLEGGGRGEQWKIRTQDIFGLKLSAA
jgi:hypothetical protein